MIFSEWREKELSEIAEIVMGQSPKGTTCNQNNEGMPLLNGPTEFGTHHPYPTQFTTDPKKTSKEGDLLFCVRGSTTGRMNWSNQKYAIGRGIAAIRPIHANTDRFIKAVIDYNLNELLRMATGSTFPNVGKTLLNSIKILAPSPLEMSRVNDLLKSIEDKIEVNNQINKTLENMAQAIFKQWFIDFEFPNEDGEPYQSSGGEMVESELGMIPKGWEVKKASDIANINIGKTPPRKEKECFTLDTNDYKWISIKDLGNSGAYILDSSEYLTKESIDKYNVKVVPDNTVVLSFKLTIGRVAITCGQMTTNEAIAHFNLSKKNKISSEYLYLYLKSFDYGKLGNTSSIATAVNSKIIKAMPILNPSKEVIKQFNEVVENLFSEIKLTIKESDQLIGIRDLLLPKLMSGEIRVSLESDGEAS